MLRVLAKGLIVMLVVLMVAAIVMPDRASYYESKFNWRCGMISVCADQWPDHLRHVVRR